MIDDDPRALGKSVHHLKEAWEIKIEAFHFIDEDEIDARERQGCDEFLLVVVEHARKLTPVEIVPVGEKNFMSERLQFV
jgi:hypothetical protein